MTEPNRLALAVPDQGEVIGYRWEGTGTRAPLVIVHGYAEHARRHARLAEAAAAAGHDVWAIDLPGHGHSPGRRALVRSYEPLMRAVGAAIAEANGATGMKPVLFGHSMGGAVALAVALRQPNEISKLVLSAPYLIDAKSRPGWMLALAGGIAAVAPELPVVRLDSDYLSRDGAVGPAYRADPLVHSGGVPAATGYTLASGGQSILSRASELAVPTLVIHGEADAVASVEGSRRLAAAAPGHVRLVIVPDAFHEMHNEPEDTGVPKLFVDEVLGFIAA